MSDITAENRALAKKVLQAFGGCPEVTRFWDDNRRSCVDISEARP